MINFLTAAVVLEVDDSKLEAQLAKAKQKVMRSTSAVEKSYRKQAEAIKKVNNRLRATVTSTSDWLGQTYKVTKVLGWWSTHALNFYRKMKRNLIIIKNIASLVKNIGKYLIWWPIKKIGKELKDLVWPVKKIEEKMKGVGHELKEVNKDLKLWGLTDILFHPIKAFKALRGTMKEGAGAIDIMNETLEETIGKVEEINEKLKAPKKSFVQISESVEATKEDLEGWVIPEGLKPGPSPIAYKGGKTMYSVLFGVPGMWSAMYDAAKWAFEGILNITTSVFQKIVNVSKWTKVGVVASLVGMYYYVTKAAMDYEDAQAKIVGTVGTTRDALKQTFAAIKHVAAEIGKPFLKNIKMISLATTQWLLENKERISAWAKTFTDSLQTLTYGFVDWIKFLSTDFKGGVSVALKVVSELFKGFAEALIILMSWAGRRAGQALVDGFRGFVTNVLPDLLEEVDKSLKWFGQKLMKAGETAARNLQRLTAMPSGPRDVRGMGLRGMDIRGIELGYGRAPTEEESASAAIARVYRERAENIKKILEGMPTWGETEAKSVKIAEEATKKYEEFNLILKEHDVQYTMDRLEAYQKMYSDMDKWNQKRYDNSIELLNREKAGYIRAGVDIVTAHEWMNYQIMELDRERAIASEDFFAGFGASVEQMQEDMITWGEIGQTVAETMESAFANAFYNMTTEGAKWSDAMRGFALDVLKAFQKQLAAQTAAFAMANIITPVLSGLGGLLFGTPSAGAVSTTPELPGLQHGGTVLQTGAAIVHKDEYIGEGGPKVTVNVINQGKDLEVEKVDEFDLPDEHVINIVVRDIVAGGKIAQLTGAK